MVAELLAALLLTASPSPPLLELEVELPLGRQRVKTDAALSLARVDGHLAVDGVVELTPLLERLGPWLEERVEARSGVCERRLHASGGRARVVKGALELRVTARFERWRCGPRKRRLLSETATLIAHLRPVVLGGRPALRVRTRMSGLRGWARIAGVDDGVRREARREVERLNRQLAAHPTLERLDGLGYTLVRLRLEADPQPRLRARWVGPAAGPELGDAIRALW